MKMACIEEKMRLRAYKEVKMGNYEDKSRSVDFTQKMRVIEL